MNNLTTRKIVFGLLTVLVLAFSVQGIADALTLTKSSGDLVTVSRNQTFTIKFSIDPDSPQEVNLGTKKASQAEIDIAAAGNSRPNTLTDDHKGKTYDADYINGETTHYYTESLVAGDGTATLRNWLTESDAYDYNDEAIAISVSSVPANATAPTFRRDGTVIPLGDDNSPSLQERHEVSDRQLSTGTSASTITLIGSSGSAGEYTITIEDVTDGEDFPGNTAPSEQASIVFTVYVVNDRDTDATGLSFANLSAENYRTDGTDFSDETVTATPVPATVDHVRVEYKVIQGSGRLYVQKDATATIPLRQSSAVTTLSTSSAAKVQLDMRGTTNKVRASIAGVAPVTAIFIFGYPTVAITGGNGEDGEDGVFGGQLDDPLVVRVTDGKGSGISGLAANFEIETAAGGMFIPVPGTTVYTINATGSTLAGARTAFTTVATSTRPVPGGEILVETDSRGEARTYFQLGTTITETSQTVTVKAGGVSPIVPANFRFTAGSGKRRPTLNILSGNNQRTNSEGDIEDPLIAVVRKDGNLQPGEEVTFRTVKGTIVGSNGTATKRATETTDGSGEAEVTYYQDPGEGRDTVTAMISGDDYEKTVTFNINGSGGGRPSPPSGPSEPSNAITITLSSTTGEPGDEIDVTVSSDPSAVVVLDSGDLDDDDFSRLFGTTPFDITIVLPDEEDTYTFSATNPSLTSDSATVTVEAELGELSITAIGAPAAGAQTFSISALDADGDRAIGVFTARLSGTGFTSRNVEISGGSGNARVTLPTAARLYTLIVSATGYTDGSTPVRIAGTGQQQQVADEEEEEETVTVSEPDSISIVGPSTRSGTVNEELGAALIVEVVDDDDNGVEDARVIFRVRSGQGRLSEAGSTVSGRAIRVLTDDDGHARANYTPTGGGTHTVKAEVKGVTRTVEFTITTGSAPADETGTRDAGTAPGSISPVVHVGAASRPPMLWVDGGAIYALVGADVQEFAPSVDNALNIAVGGGKVYWTEKTGDAGTINSANLNGSDVTELTSIKAVPMGIAVDTAGSKLYWTNSRGRIQSANLDGSGITNVLQNLPNPMDIALAGGNAYWTQHDATRGEGVGIVNLRGQNGLAISRQVRIPLGVSLSVAVKSTGRR